MIQLFEPTPQLKHYTAAAKASIASKMIDNGAAARVFEEQIAKRLGVPPAWVAVTNSCTAALTCAYHFLVGNRPLAVPVMTWPGTYCGHRGPVEFYDRSPVNVRRVTGVVVVDMYGTGENSALWYRPEVRPEAVIMDAAHNCFGYKKLDFALFDAVAYSFGPIKELSTVHGGCLVSPHMTWEWRAFLHYGAVGRDSYMTQAGNYCMPDFNARLGLAQLPEFDENRAKRQALLYQYTYLLGGHMLTRVAKLGEERNPSGHVAIARLPSKDERDFVRAYLATHGIPTGHHYPLPKYVLPELYPESKALSETVLTLPLHLNLTTEQVNEICNHVKEALRLCIPTA